MKLQKGYGVDIAARRIDDLDKKIISQVCQAVGTGTIPTVLDLGCGAGGLSTKLAEAGAHIFAIDIDNYASSLNHSAVNFIQGDITDVQQLLQDKQFDYCVCQRTLHYVPYTTALEVLKYLSICITEKLYISISGLESDIGRRYADKDKSIENRFSRLIDEDAKTFRIFQSICLYTPEEFIVLLQDSGWQVEECWVSAFGNVKAVCRT